VESGTLRINMVMDDMMINMAADFDAYPSGRVPSDGKYNGESFREELLYPAISEVIEGKTEDKKVIVDIDGVRSFGSSFLEEAFGGLVRNRNLTANQILDVLTIQCTKNHLLFYKDSIIGYIRDAKKLQTN